MDNYREILKVDKKSAVAYMFNSIAWRYDFLNHLLSFGIDRSWRKKAIHSVSGRYTKPEVLDVATGTGDLAIAALKLNPVRVTGIDISQNMIEKGRHKIAAKGLERIIELKEGDTEKLEFNDNVFDITMVAFGVRNFSDPQKGLKEMYRVLRSTGTLMILEFSKPVRFPFRQIYFIYFRNILPFIGRLFSNDRNAYRYLPESVMLFPDIEDFIRLIESAGFTNVYHKKLTGGIASIYTGIKP